MSNANKNAIKNILATIFKRGIGGEGEIALFEIEIEGRGREGNFFPEPTISLLLLTTYNLALTN